MLRAHYGRRSLAGGGVVKLRKGEVGKVAAALVRQFHTCGKDMVTPPPDYISVCAHARESYVCVVPTRDVHWMAKGDLVVGGYYSPSGKQIRLRVEEDQCAPRKWWARRMRETLRHEMTHAADPYVHIRRTPYAKASHSKFCKYVRDPVEVAANLAEVQEQLLNQKQSIRLKTYRGSITRPEDILYESPKYEHIKRCLTPKINRRFLQMAAKLWTSGKFGPLPRQR